MKILIDARFYGLEHAGLGRYTINLVQELARHDDTNSYVILLREKYYQILSLPKNWTKVKLEAKHYTLKEQANLPLVIRKYKPDITHFLHSNIPIFFTGKFIVTIHDMTMYKQGIDATTLPLPLYLLKRIPFKLIFRKAVYESEKIIVPSQAVKNEVVEYFKIPREKVIVTYEGVSQISKFKVQSAKLLEKYGIENKSYFLYVGNLYPHKNIKRAIEAVGLLNKEARERIDFVIVSGRGVFRERLLKDIKGLKANEYVKVLDFIPDEELQVLYTNAKAFVFPSLSEGFGLPGLEALQAGTQLLASDIPVFREIYSNYAFYFDPRNADSIKETMQKVLNGDKKKDATGLLKEYSWEKMGRETLKEYLKIL